MPLFLMLAGAGALVWFLTSRNEHKQLGDGSEQPIPIDMIPSDDFGLLMTYHAVMVDPSAFDEESRKALNDELFAQGYVYEAKDMINRVMGALYPTDVLVYHDMMLHPNNYSPDQIGATGMNLQAAGFTSYARDLGILVTPKAA